jgi:GH35 family endo-1,4-beta-xylanase
MTARMKIMGAAVVLVTGLSAFGQPTGYVKKGTWQETILESREGQVGLPARQGGGAIWRQVERDFNNTEYLEEMTMEKVGGIWETDWPAGDQADLVKRYAEATKRIVQYIPADCDEAKSGEELQQKAGEAGSVDEARGIYYKAFRLMEDAVLAEADRKIKEHRMGTLIIKVRPGAKVEVRQVRHDFLFGTSVNDKMFAKKEDFQTGRKWLNDFDWLNDANLYPFIEANRERYYQLIKDNFNCVVYQNAAKWFNVEPVEEGDVYWTSAERTCEWAMANDLKMRGHCVVWGCERFVPEWQKTMDDANLRRNIERRCKEVATRFKGRIDEWDLNNEMLYCRWYRDKLGDGIIGDMFRWCKEANPDMVLCLNDFGILGNEHTSRLADYVAQAKGFMAKGYPLGQINCQGHSWDGATNVGFIRQSLDKLTRSGLPVKISEYVIDDQAGNKEYAAVMLDKHFRVFFSQPGVEAIIFWGVWEGTHYSPSDAIWNLDFTPTECASAYRRLVFERWWTNWQGVTDDKGRCEAPVFYGRHKVTIDGKEIEVNFPKAEGREKTVETGGA